MASFYGMYLLIINFLLFSFTSSFKLTLTFINITISIFMWFLFAWNIFSHFISSYSYLNQLLIFKVCFFVGRILLGLFFFFNSLTIFFSFFKIYYYIISKLYTQGGAWTHGPEIKSHMLYQLSQPAPLQSFFFKE